MSFISIGTEQPQDLTQIKAKDKNKFLPIHLQEVKQQIQFLGFANSLNQNSSR